MLSGKPQCGESELPVRMVTATPVIYFWRCRHRDEEGQCDFGSSAVAGTVGWREGWKDGHGTALPARHGWHGCALGCGKHWRHTGGSPQSPPSLVLVSIRSSFLPWDGPKITSPLWPGGCLGVLAPSWGLGGQWGRCVKAWHCLLAALLFSWPWRSCFPSPPPAGTKPSWL